MHFSLEEALELVIELILISGVIAFGFFLFINMHKFTM